MMEKFICFKIDNYYSPEKDRGIAFDDSELDIDWKVPYQDLKLSEKDMKQPSFADAEYFNLIVSFYV